MKFLKTSLALITIILCFSFNLSSLRAMGNSIPPGHEWGRADDYNTMLKDKYNSNCQYGCYWFDKANNYINQKLYETSYYYYSSSDARNPNEYIYETDYPEMIAAGEGIILYSSDKPVYKVHLVNKTRELITKTSTLFASVSISNDFIRSNIPGIIFYGDNYFNYVEVILSDETKRYYNPGDVLFELTPDGYYQLSETGLAPDNMHLSKTISSKDISSLYFKTFIKPIDKDYKIKIEYDGTNGILPVYLASPLNVASSLQDTPGIYNPWLELDSLDYEGIMCDLTEESNKSIYSCSIDSNFINSLPGIEYYHQFKWYFTPDNLKDLDGTFNLYVENNMEFSVWGYSPRYELDLFKYQLFGTDFIISGSDKYELYLNSEDLVFVKIMKYNSLTKTFIEEVMPSFSLNTNSNLNGFKIELEKDEYIRLLLDKNIDIFSNTSFLSFSFVDKDGNTTITKPGQPDEDINVAPAPGDGGNIYFNYFNKIFDILFPWLPQMQTIIDSIKYNNINDTPPEFIVGPINFLGLPAMKIVDFSFYLQYRETVFFWFKMSIGTLTFIKLFKIIVNYFDKGGTD